MEWIVATGSTVEQARERALDQLGVALEDAEFEVMVEPTSSLFGLRKTPAQVRARVRPVAPPPKQDTRQRGRDRSRGGRRSRDRGRQGAPGGKAPENKSAPKKKPAQAKNSGQAKNSSQANKPRQKASLKRGQAPRSGGGSSPSTSADQPSESRRRTRTVSPTSRSNTRSTSDSPGSTGTASSDPASDDVRRRPRKIHP